MGEPWYPGETLNSSIGQGFTEATPMQLATATMLMANKGKWHQPAMLKRVGIGNADIDHPSQFADIQLRNPDDWTFIQEAMASVVHKDRREGYRTNGTAYDAIGNAKDNRLVAYRMGGKSGTAQVAAMAADFDKNAVQAEELRDHALFIAFAPVDAPKIAVAVFVEHGEAGSGMAGPIARKLLDAYLLGPDGQLKPEFQPPAAPVPLISLNP
jgi:penicillin-binding protein 2